MELTQDYSEQDRYSQVRTNGPDQASHPVQLTPRTLTIELGLASSTPDRPRWPVWYVVCLRIFRQEDSERMMRFLQRPNSNIIVINLYTPSMLIFR